VMVGIAAVRGSPGKKRRAERDVLPHAPTLLNCAELAA
jgi:hypothetical protein